MISPDPATLAASLAAEDRAELELAAEPVNPPRDRFPALDSPARERLITAGLCEGWGYDLVATELGRAVLAHLEGIITA